MSYIISLHLNEFFFIRSQINPSKSTSGQLNETLRGKPTLSN